MDSLTPVDPAPHGLRPAVDPQLPGPQWTLPLRELPRPPPPRSHLPSPPHYPQWTDPGGGALTHSRAWAWRWVAAGVRQPAVVAQVSLQPVRRPAGMRPPRPVDAPQRSYQRLTSGGGSTDAGPRGPCEGGRAGSALRAHRPSASWTPTCHPRALGAGGRGRHRWACGSRTPGEQGPGTGLQTGLQPPTPQEGPFLCSLPAPQGGQHQGQVHF